LCSTINAHHLLPPPTQSEHLYYSVLHTHFPILSRQNIQYEVDTTSSAPSHHSSERHWPLIDIHIRLCALSFVDGFLAARSVDSFGSRLSACWIIATSSSSSTRGRTRYSDPDSTLKLKLRLGLATRQSPSKLLTSTAQASLFQNVSCVSILPALCRIPLGTGHSGNDTSCCRAHLLCCVLRQIIHGLKHKHFTGTRMSSLRPCCRAEQLERSIHPRIINQQHDCQGQSPPHISHQIMSWSRASRV
jgi:hypothetical protein